MVFDCMFEEYLSRRPTIDENAKEIAERSNIPKFNSMGLLEKWKKQYNI